MISIGSLFSRAAIFLYDNPRSSLTGLLAVLLLASMPLDSLKPLDVSLEGLLGREAPENVSYSDYKQIFGSDEVITLLLSGEPVLSEEFLRKLATLHEDISNRVPQVGQVISLVNAPLVARNKNRTSVGRAFMPWPEDTAAVQARLDMVRTGKSPYYRALVNADGNRSLLFIRLVETSGSGEVLSGNDRYAEAIDAVMQIAAEHSRTDFRIEVTGQATILAALRGMLVRDLFLLPIAALFASILALLALFRRRSAVAIPALVIALPLTGTFSLMALLGYPVQQPTALIPPFIVIISVAGTVHLLTSFYSHYTSSGDKRNALGSAFMEKGSSLLMTTMTTAAALFSFSFAELGPIANLGLFGSFGTLLTLASTLVVLPIYVRLSRIRPLADHEGQVGGILRGSISRLIDGSVDVAATHTSKVLVIAIMLLLTSAVVATQLRFSHNVLNWLPTQWPVLQSSKLADHEFHSGVSVEVLIDSGRAGGVTDPEFINRVSALASAARTISLPATPIGLTVSIDDYLRPMRGGNTFDQELYPPGNNGTRLVVRDFNLLRLAAPELLASVTSPDLRYTRISVRTHTTDASAYAPLLDAVGQHASDILADRYHVRITGQVSILATTLEALASSAKNSYLLSLGVIALMMAFLLQSIRDGLFSLLPNMLPVTIVLAGMWLLGIHLDLFTMLVVSIAMGLVVDDTIHFMAHFRRHFAFSGNAEEAARQALRDTGRAMVISTTVLVTGIQFLYLSELHSVGVFGSLTAAVMIFGLVADFLVAPAVMIWLYRNHRPLMSADPAPHE